MPVEINTQTISGAKIVIETLKKLSVDTVFGYPGGVVLDLYDELYKQNDIKHILVRHEQSAVHTAEGYARESSKCGVVFVTAGPGATNTVTGIVNAYLDSYPVLVIAGSVSKDCNQNGYQDVNLCEMTKSCTKAGFKITNANDIQNTITKAHDIAMSGKKGPVVIEILKDVLSQNIEYNRDFEYQRQKTNLQNPDIQILCSRLKYSKKPIIVAGGGVHHSNAYDELNIFAKQHNIPVVCSMMGIGSYNQNEDNYFGMIGVNGDNCANELVKQSDLIISLGCRFNNRVTCIFDSDNIITKTVCIDIEAPKQFSDCIRADIKTILQKLNDENINNYSHWCNIAKEYKKLNKPQKKLSNMLHGFEVLQKLNEYTKNKNVIFTSDVGQHQVLAVKNLTLGKDRKIYVSGGSGTMGFGLPCAIGAAIANPESCIVCITGDGSFQMSLNELAICSDLGLNIKVVILNNGYLGMVRQLQEQNCAGRYSQTKISNPDFVKLAQSYGIEALKVQSSAGIDKALESAFSKKNTFILDFDIESLEIV